MLACYHDEGIIVLSCHINFFLENLPTADNISALSGEHGTESIFGAVVLSMSSIDKAVGPYNRLLNTFLGDADKILDHNSFLRNRNKFQNALGSRYWLKTNLKENVDVLPLSIVWLKIYLFLHGVIILISPLMYIFLLIVK
jgi:hypothetical protein